MTLQCIYNSWFKPYPFTFKDSWEKYEKKSMAGLVFRRRDKEVCSRTENLSSTKVVTINPFARNQFLKDQKWKRPVTLKKTKAVTYHPLVSERLVNYNDSDWQYKALKYWQWQVFTLGLPMTSVTLKRQTPISERLVVTESSFCRTGCDRSPISEKTGSYRDQSPKDLQWRTPVFQRMVSVF